MVVTVAVVVVVVTGVVVVTVVVVTVVVTLVEAGTSWHHSAQHIGYINTLTIELAGSEAGGPGKDAARKEEASQLLNITFQCGMTLATVLSMVVAHFVAA